VRGRVDGMAGFFVDVHSHVVPSGDDGVQSRGEGLELCRRAAERGTSVLFATPHVWPGLTLTEEREAAVRAAIADMAPAAAAAGVDLRLGFELTPTPTLLDQDPRRYRLGGLEAVLMEVPFHGSLTLSERLAEHIEAAGLLPVIAHPERSERVQEAPALAAGLREREWLLQVNATSLLGYHGPEIEATAWELLDRGLVDLVGSDGHRTARPPFLDEAYRLVRGRVGERAEALFDGRALGVSRSLPARDRVDLAQGS
jgi:protein-tyrosine phosphatase